MLGKDELDKIFSEGLSQVQPFDREEQQWQHVSARLRKDRRSYFLWLLPLLFTLLSIASFLINYHIDTSSKVNTSDQTVMDKSIAPDTKNQKSSEKIITKESTDKNSENYQAKKEPEYKMNLSKPDKEKILDDPKNTTSPSSNIGSSSSINHFDLSTENESQLFFNNLSDKSVYARDDINEMAKKNSTYPTEMPLREVQNTSQNDLNENVRPLLSKFAILNASPPEISRQTQIPKSPEIVVNPPFSARKLRFSIGTGVFSEFLKMDSIIDNRNAGWASRFAIHYSKLSLKVGYRRQKLDRSIGTEVSQYNVVDSNFVYGYGNPNSTTLNYTNHLFDLTLGYDLISYYRMHWGIQAGLQARKISTGNISYSYVSYNEPIILENEIPSSGIELSDIRYGISTQFDINPLLSLNLEYNMIQSLNIENIKWPRRHQLELGLVLHLN